MNFHRYFPILFAILLISGVKSNEELYCMHFNQFTYNQIAMGAIWIAGVPNYTTVVDYLESNKNTYYSGVECDFCDPNDNGPCDLEVNIIGFCTDESSDPADCAAVVVYNGDECNNASWCSLWLEFFDYLPSTSTTIYSYYGSFSADCSGISSEYPSCTITCKNNVTTAEACWGDIAPSPGSSPSDAPLSPPGSTVEPTKEPSSPSDVPVSTPSSTAEPVKEPSQPSSPSDVQTDSAYFGAGSSVLIFFTSLVAGSVIALVTGG